MGSTGNPRFLADGGRRAFLLVFTAQSGFGSPDPTPGIAAAVRGALVNGYIEQTTGIGALQSTGSRGGNGLLVETLLGASGALVVLVVVSPPRWLCCR